MPVSIGEIIASLKADTSQFHRGMQQATTQLRQVGTAAQQTERTTSQAFTSLQRSSQGLSSAFVSLRGAVGGITFALLTREALQFASEGIQVSTRIQNMTTAFQTITGSAQGSQAALAFVRQEANRLGVDFLTAAKGFQDLTAATRNTVLAGEQTQKIFLAMAEASRIFGLSAERTKLAMDAIVRIMSTGVVQLDELRNELGTHLPGAFHVAARAMRTTTGDLAKMITEGLASTDFLPKFAAQWRKEVAGGITDASQKFDAAMGRMRNASTDLQGALGDLITRNPQVIQGIERMAGVLRDLQGTVTSLRQPLGSLISFFVQLAEQLGKVTFGSLMRDLEALGQLGQRLGSGLGQILPMDDILSGLKAIDAFAGRMLPLGQALNPNREVEQVTTELEAARQKLQQLQAQAAEQPLESAVGASAQADIVKVQQGIAQLHGQLQALKAQPLVEEAPTTVNDLQRVQQQIATAEQKLRDLQATATAGLSGAMAKAVQDQITLTEAVLANLQGKLDALHMPPITGPQAAAEIQRVEQALGAAQQQLKVLVREAEKQSLAQAFGQNVRNEIAATEAQIAKLQARLDQLQAPTITMPEVTLAAQAPPLSAELLEPVPTRADLRDQLKGGLAAADELKRKINELSQIRQALNMAKVLGLGPDEVKVLKVQAKEVEDAIARLKDPNALKKGRAGGTGRKEVSLAEELEKDLRGLAALQKIADATGLPIDTLSQRISLLSSALQQQLRGGANEASAAIQSLVEQLRQAYQEAGEAEANFTLDNLREQFADIQPGDFAAKLSAATFAEAGQAVEALQVRLQLLNEQRQRAASITGDVERVKELNAAIVQTTAALLEQTLAQIEASGARPLEGLQQQLQALEATRQQALDTPGQALWVQQLDQDIAQIQERILTFEIGQIPALSEAMLQAGVVMNGTELAAQLLETALRAAITDGASPEVVAALIERLRAVKDQIDATYATDTKQRFRDEQEAALRATAVQIRQGTTVGRRESLIAEREQLLEAQAAHPGIIDERVSTEALLRINAELGRTTLLGQGLTVVAEGIGDAFAQSMQGIIQGTVSVKQAFENMVQSILLSIGKLLIQQGVMTVLQIALGGIGAGMTGGVGGGVGTAAPLALQHGAIIKKPTMALVGEAGNELVVPLDDLPRNMMRLLGTGKAKDAARQILDLGGGRQLKLPQIALAEGAVVAPRGFGMGSTPLANTSRAGGQDPVTLNNYTIVVSSTEEAQAKAADLRQLEHTVVSIIDRQLMKGSGSSTNRLLRQTLR